MCCSLTPLQTLPDPSTGGVSSRIWATPVAGSLCHHRVAQNLNHPPVNPSPPLPSGIAGTNPMAMASSFPARRIWYLRSRKLLRATGSITKAISQSSTNPAPSIASPIGCGATGHELQGFSPALSAGPTPPIQPRCSGARFPRTTSPPGTETRTTVASRIPRTQRASSAG